MSERAPVIVVGGGPVGLGAALELARFGVRSTVLEKHPTTSWHPKTRNFDTRTMEITRGWGPVAHRPRQGQGLRTTGSGTATRRCRRSIPSAPA